MIAESYRTLAGPGRDEVIIQKSRFIGQAWPCATEEEALGRLREVREQTRDARHHCYAYIIGKNEGILRYSDDGEPGGTAGMPILSLLRSEHLVDCCCIVTRYFGGILLGTGGLVRAYTQGCRIALDAARIVRMERTCLDLCEVPYSCWDALQYTLGKLPATIQDLSFGASVSFTLLTRSRDRTEVLRQLEQVTSRQLLSLEDGEKYAAWEE